MSNTHFITQKKRKNLFKVSLAAVEQLVFSAAIFTLRPVEPVGPLMQLKSVTVVDVNAAKRKWCSWWQPKGSVHAWMSLQHSSQLQVGCCISCLTTHICKIANYVAIFIANIVPVTVIQLMWSWHMTNPRALSWSDDIIAPIYMSIQVSTILKSPFFCSLRVKIKSSEWKETFVLQSLPDAQSHKEKKTTLYVEKH